MKKYIIYIDYMADYTANGGKSCEYIKANAKDLLAAIEEADTLYNENVYLIRIMESIANPEKEEDYRTQIYRAVIAKRGNGWHRNNAEYCENGHVIMRTWNKNFETIETI